MKQTAIEWLKKELEKYGEPLCLSISWTIFDELIEQSKAMEREQINRAFDDGVCHLITPKKRNPLRYYNETYGGEQ
jgi:hypothetical protein